MSKPEDSWEAVTTEGKFVPQVLHSTGSGTWRGLCNETTGFGVLQVHCSRTIGHAGDHSGFDGQGVHHQWDQVIPKMLKDALCSASSDFKGMAVVCDGPYDHSGAHFVVLPDKSLYQWREVPNT